jgi:hypothetical protein
MQKLIVDFPTVSNMNWRNHVPDFFDIFFTEDDINKFFSLVYKHFVNTVPSKVSIIPFIFRGLFLNKSKVFLYRTLLLIKFLCVIVISIASKVIF